MNARKIYRIELKSSDWSIPVDVATLAALSNGGQYMNLFGIEMYAKAKFMTSSVSEGFTVSRIGESSLTIDKGTENLLILTEVEILELDKPEISAKEARDILDELAPTLNRQMDDETNSQLLN